MSDEIQTPDSGATGSEPVAAPTWEDTLAKTADAIEAREPVRGENGQFQPKVVADQAPAAAEVPGGPQTAQTPDPQPVVIEAPQSLPADVKGEWAKLPPSVQKYWADRESEIHKRFTTDGERLKSLSAFEEVLKPYQGQLQQYQVPAPEYVRRLAHADQLLAQNFEQGIQEVYRLYGRTYPAASQPGAQPDPNSALAQRYSQLQQKVESLEQASETAKLSAAQESVNAFKKDRPHFDAVETLMSELMETGAAQKVPGDAPLLEKAYTLAITIHPEVKAAIAKEEADKAAAKAAEEAKQKAAQDAKVAPFAKRPGSVQTAPLKGKTWEDTLRRSADEVYARG